MQTDNDQLSACEIAGRARKSLRAIRYDIEHGFPMPGGRATFNEWRAWKAKERESRMQLRKIAPRCAPDVMP